MLANAVQLSLGVVDAVLVEGGDGSIYKVRGEECSCGVAGCRHVKRAEKYLARHKDTFYFGKSALHKAIRLNEQVRAVASARMLERFKTGSTISYLQGIVTEETRNLELLRLVRSRALSKDDLVRMFAASTKDWELGWDCGACSPRWLLSKEPRRRVSAESLFWALDEGDTDEALSQFLFFFFGGRRGLFGETGPSPEVKEAIPELGKVAAAKWPKWTEEIEWLAKKTWVDRDDMVLLFEMAAGIWVEEEACAFSEVPKVDPTYEMPYLHVYVFDKHTYWGAQQISKAVAHGLIGFGKPMPRGIDMRYSGSYTGTMWRYFAQQQHGSITVPWEAVAVPAPCLKVFHDLVGWGD